MFFEAPGLRRHALMSSVFMLSALLLLPAVSARAEVLQSDAFIFPRGIALEADGNFVVCDQASDTVIRVDPATGNRTIVSSASVATEELVNA
jgi:hypothetical protein